MNDQFFSLQDMNKFLDEQDALLEKDPATFNKPLEELYQSDDEEVLISIYNLMTCSLFTLKNYK